MVNFDLIVGWIRYVMNNDTNIPERLGVEPGKMVYKELARENTPTPYLVVSTPNIHHALTFNGNRIFTRYDVNIICVDKVGHDRDDQVIMNWVDNLFNKVNGNTDDITVISCIITNELSYRDPWKSDYRMVGVTLQIEAI